MDAERQHVVPAVEHALVGWVVEPQLIAPTI
jgi:hypothetical protein